MEIGIELDFFEPEGGPMKATAHKSGKLGFTQAANKVLDFANNKLFKIGRKKGDGDDTLYMIPVETKDETTFDVLKAGDYYYIKAKRLFNSLGVDYANETEATSFEIDEIKENDKKYYKLRKKKKKANNTLE